MAPRLGVELHSTVTDPQVGLGCPVSRATNNKLDNKMTKQPITASHLGTIGIPPMQYLEFIRRNLLSRFRPEDSLLSVNTQFIEIIIDGITGDAQTFGNCIDAVL